jgi:hypothetical protein
MTITNKIFLILILLASNLSSVRAEESSPNSTKDYISLFGQIVQYLADAPKRDKKKKDQSKVLAVIRDIVRNNGDINQCLDTPDAAGCIKGLTTYGRASDSTICDALNFKKNDVMDYKAFCKETFLTEQLCRSYYTNKYGKEFIVADSNFNPVEQSGLKKTSLSCYVIDSIKKGDPYAYGKDKYNESIQINENICKLVINQELKNICIRDHI